MGNAWLDDEAAGTRSNYAAASTSVRATTTPAAAANADAAHLPAPAFPANVWDAILRRCSRSDCAAVRSTCQAWHADVARCLHKLMLRHPSNTQLEAAAVHFPGMSKLKLQGHAAGQELHADVLASCRQLSKLTIQGPWGNGSSGLNISNLAALASCSRLDTLQLSNCALGPGLHTVTTLTSLQLLSCETWPPDMAALATLPALAHLSIDCLDCGVRQGRSALSNIGKLCHLQSLDLLVHHLLGAALFQQLGQLTALTELKLVVVRVAPNYELCLPDVLRPLAAVGGLRALHVEGLSRASDRDLACAAQLPHLTSLQLHLAPSEPYDQRPSSGIITAAGARAVVEGLPGLCALALAGCHVTRDGLAQLGAMRRLRAIDLTGVANVDDAFMFHLAAAGLSALTHLDLSGCRLVSDLGLAVVARCFPCLQHLDLSKCSVLVTDAGIGRLGVLRRLQSLSLAACEKVTSEGITALARRRPPLTSLNLHSCVSLRDGALAAIAAHLPGLQVLNLDYCPQVTNRGVRSLSSLMDLKQLSLVGTLFAPTASTQQLQRRLKRLTYARASCHWLL